MDGSGVSTDDGGIIFFAGVISRIVATGSTFYHVTLYVDTYW